MTASETSASPSLLRDMLSAIRHHLGSRTGLVAMAAIALGGGAYFNWTWLVAAGIAPLIISAAPCAAMCALGLCMSGRSKTASTPDSSAEPSKLTDETKRTHGKGCC